MAAQLIHQTSLRRSIIGSIGSIKSTKRTTTPSTPKSGTPTHCSPSDYHTRFPPATNGPSVISPEVHNGLAKVDEGAHLPVLDRGVDLVALDSAPISPTDLFDALSPILPNVHKFFELPASVRHLIYEYCFDSQDEQSEGEAATSDNEPKSVCGSRRPISLSPQFATKAVFAAGYFASPWDILRPVWGALQSSSVMRNNLMAYFWTVNSFHVTLNPFTGPQFSPLSQTWLTTYLPIIQHLTVEVDMTRFGGSMPDPTLFGHDVNKLERLFCALVEGILCRQSDAQTHAVSSQPTRQMAELTLFCRRYAGNRTCEIAAAAETTHSTLAHMLTPNKHAKIKVPHVPSYTSRVCDPVLKLCGVLRQCRISGFSSEYTQELFKGLFGERSQSLLDDSENSELKSTTWPRQIYRAPSPQTCQKNSRKNYILPPVQPHPSSSDFSPLMIPESPSFASEFRGEIYRKFSTPDNLNSRRDFWDPVNAADIHSMSPASDTSERALRQPSPELPKPLASKDEKPTLVTPSIKSPPKPVSGLPRFAGAIGAIGAIRRTAKISTTFTQPPHAVMSPLMPLEHTPRARSLEMMKNAETKLMLNKRPSHQASRIAYQTKYATESPGIHVKTTVHQKFEIKTPELSSKSPSSQAQINTPIHISAKKPIPSKLPSFTPTSNRLSKPSSTLNKLPTLSPGARTPLVSPASSSKPSVLSPITHLPPASPIESSKPSSSKLAIPKGASRVPKKSPSPENSKAFHNNKRPLGSSEEKSRSASNTSLPITPASARLLTPNPDTPRCGTPDTVKPAPSPNTMNKLNENDPAFRRALIAFTPEPVATSQIPAPPIRGVGDRSKTYGAALGSFLPRPTAGSQKKSNLPVKQPRNPAADKKTAGGSSGFFSRFLKRPSDT